MYGYCVTCDKPLAGRQRYYCSNQCRKRYERLAAQWPFLADKQPLSVAFGRDAASFGRDTTAITTILVVTYKTNGIGQGLDSDMERFAVKSLYRPKVAKAAVEVLKELFQGWDFEIKSVEVHST